MAAKILLIDDDLELLSALAGVFSLKGYPIKTADGAASALALLETYQPDIVLCDINMPGKSGFVLMEEAKKLHEIKWWVFISGRVSPENIEKAASIGATDFLEKPFTFETVDALIQRLNEKDRNPMFEIMEVVQGITGIQLGVEKKLLVETRLTRRMRILGISSLEEYMKFFRKNRPTELKELVSLVSTHTTEFFRESGHFDYLFDEVFPKLLQSSQPVVIWSAACSSGEECYSLAIAWCEFLRSKKLAEDGAPILKIYGTDVSAEQVEKARQGIYSRQAIERVNPGLIEKYFDVGTGEIENLIRVKEFVHKMCKFGVANLLSEDYPDIKPQVVFLRNVLIYFKSADIEKISRSILKMCAKDGYLFLGHSESLSGLKTGFQLVGNSIYMPENAVVATPKVAAHKAIQPMSGKPSVSELKKIFIVDDSLTIRKMLHRIFDKDHGFEIIGEAETPIQAEAKLKGLKPDAMTLDIHMPEMDGVSYLEKIKANPKPFPIVVLSSINYDDAVGGLKCLELGAFDYIEKPQGLNLDQEAERIRVVVEAAVKSKARPLSSFSNAKAKAIYSNIMANDLILIGASTGGVEAIMALLKQFPKNSPPILIVQHIPPIFSNTFARRLTESCEIEVIEGTTSSKLSPGKAYIAPGGKQMGVYVGPKGIELLIKDDEPVNRHKPSVDYLFNSIANSGLTEKLNIVATLLTGMGSDGAKGLKQLRDLGVHTIAQDEDTCVVFGMPKEAIKLGAAKEILPLPSISYHIFNALKKRSAA